MTLFLALGSRVSLAVGLILVSSAGQAAPFAYLSMCADDRVLVVDTASGAAATMYSSASAVYVAEHDLSDHGSVVEFETQHFTTTATIPNVANAPWGISITPDGAHQMNHAAIAFSPMGSIGEPGCGERNE
jgi:DNA-binding beta-propeller fold protein YncE